MNENAVRIVADIGGTNARFACVRGESQQLEGIRIFPCAEYTFLEDAIRAYMTEMGIGDVAGICLAVAGPVDSDTVDLPNNHWCFSRSDITRSLGVPLKVINDFTAQALCLDYLAPDELYWVGKPRPRGGQIRLIVGPGTGLGVAALSPDGWVLPSEGGHVGFAPTEPHQVELLQTLWQRHDRVSVERILSGQGLANLYWANARLRGEERELPAPEVAAGARAGDELCLAAVEDFFAILAGVAGDMALMVWSVDGVYLSGGILPKIREFFDEEKFRARFENKGRFRAFCSSVPIALVCAEQPGLLGCLAALNQSEREPS